MLDAHLPSLGGVNSDLHRDASSVTSIDDLRVHAIVDRVLQRAGHDWSKLVRGLVVLLCLFQLV